MKHTGHEITVDEARELLSQMVDEKGSQSAVAKWLGVSDAYLSDILNGNRGVSDDIARKLGYRKVVVYVREAGE